MKLVECGAGQEVVYSPARFDRKNLEGTVEQILAHYKKKNPAATEAATRTLREQLLESAELRNEWARDAGLKMPDVKKGVVYSSDTLEVGEWVVAIGHPRGLDHTVTHGIISAKHRRGITDPSNYQDFLQTDTAINPGNSGGPLLNLRGEVIGVNTAIASQTGGFEGIGFAIPSNMAVSIAKALIAHGKVERAWLGVNIQDVTPELGQSFGLPALKGVLVAAVAKGGPAAQAGIVQGDVILTYGGTDVADANALRTAVATTPIGQKMALTVWRHGQKHELTATVRSLEDSTHAVQVSIKDRLGVTVRVVTDRDVERYHLDDPQGVVITWIDPHGALGKEGFEVDDILLAIDEQPIASVETLAEYVAGLTPPVQLTVQALDHRSGQTDDVEIVLR